MTVCCLRKTVGYLPTESIIVEQATLGMVLRMVRRGMLGFLLPLTLASNLLTFFLLARMTLLSDPSTSITISTTDPEREAKDRPVLEQLVERISGGEWQQEHPEDGRWN